MQKPLTFRPPCCDLTYRPRWPGRWATLSTLLQNHTSLIHCHCVAWRLMQLSSDVEALWRVSSVWPIHGSGFKQHCLGANNTFPQESAAQLTSGPLQFHAQNEVSGDTEKRREMTLQPFPCSFADISTVSRYVGFICSLPRRSGRETIMRHGTRRSPGRSCSSENLPSSLAPSLLQPGGNLLMGFITSK